MPGTKKRPGRALPEAHPKGKSGQTGRKRAAEDCPQDPQEFTHGDHPILRGHVSIALVHCPRAACTMLSYIIRVTELCMKVFWQCTAFKNIELTME